MDKYTETFKTWNKVASAYEDKFMDLDLYNDTYDLFCELLTSNTSKVLEVGCGPGNITRYMLSKRPEWDVLGIDIAEEMLVLAKKNNPTAKFLIMDSREIDSINSSFNAIVSGFCLPYLSKSDRLKFFVDCKNLLINDGLLYMSFVEGGYEKSGFKKGRDGDRAYFYYHDMEEITQELKENNFDIIHVLKKDYEVKDKEPEVHTIMIVIKRESI